MNNSPASYAQPLQDLSVLRATGADAASFLHGQLTQDITGLQPGQARLAGYCTPKGRLLGTLIIWRDPGKPDDLVALLKTDIAQALTKRLSMFVLRAKAKLELSSEQVLGVTGPASSTTTQIVVESTEQTLQVPATAAPWSVVVTAQGTWVSAPAARSEQQRWWLVTQGDETAQASAQNLAAWQADDVAAGLPWIEAATQDTFIPQTLNLDLIDGVNFTKGCYPGQEVVARSHYQGTIKRRMAYGVSEAAATRAGSDVFDANKPDSPVGRLINASTHNGQNHLLLEIHLADQNSADYRLGTADGPSIEIKPLPYPLQNEAG